VIHDVDESIRTLLREYVEEAGVEVNFERPPPETGGKRRTKPRISAYLYDVREEVDLRRVGYDELLVDENGGVVRRPPPRLFRLSYVLTVSAGSAEDEHRILSYALACFLRFDAIPREALGGTLEGSPIPVRLTVATPTASDAQQSGIWRALGVELKASLQLIVVAPFDTNKFEKAGPLVLQRRLRVRKGVPPAEPTTVEPRPRPGLPVTSGAPRVPPPAPTRPPGPPAAKPPAPAPPRPPGAAPPRPPGTPPPPGVLPPGARPVAPAEQEPPPKPPRPKAPILEEKVFDRIAE
jgi:hypothetical protein